MTSSGDRSVIAPELGEPAIREGGLFDAAGFGEVGPAIVVVVLADRGGERRVEPEQLGQEIVEAAGEVGHVRESTAGDGSAAQRHVRRALPGIRSWWSRSRPGVRRARAGGSMPGSDHCRSPQARCRDGPEPLLAATAAGKKRSFRQRTKRVSISGHAASGQGSRPGVSD